MPKGKGYGKMPRGMKNSGGKANLKGGSPKQVRTMAGEPGGLKQRGNSGSKQSSQVREGTGGYKSSVIMDG